MKKAKLLFIILILLCINAYSQTAIEPAIGDGSSSNPYEIESLENLYWIGEDISRWSHGIFYIQVDNIDASETAGWFDGQGWIPLGNENDPFRASYNGQGHTIDGLHINRPNLDYVGLFGSVIYQGHGSISNLGLTNVDITGKSYVGALAGRYNEFQSAEIHFISNYSTGIVSGTKDYIGGLVGMFLNNTMSNCYSEATVSGDTIVGGLIGWLYYNLENSYATGDVSGVERVGGLVGHIGGEGFVINSYSTGNVYGTSERTGGLAGRNSGSIDNSYSTGNVTGVDYVGGLAGVNRNQDALITNSYSSGNVTGNQYVGGLVGYNLFCDLCISESYSTANVQGHGYVGGLTGKQLYSSIQTSYSSGNVKGAMITGGLVGQNGNEATIIDCYSTSSVTADSCFYNSGSIGGLVGINAWESTVNRSYSTGLLNTLECYSPIGGLIGNNWSNLTYSSYWNTETSNQPQSYGGYAKTTEDMTYPYEISTYLNFIFNSIWYEDSTYINNGYPYFPWQDFPESTLTLLAPMGGENWPAGTNKSVYWNSNTSSPLNIMLSFNNGNSWVYLNSEPIPAQQGYYSFTIPAINSEECLIKIQSVHIPDSFFDVSNSTFKISTNTEMAYVLLTEPQGQDMKIQSSKNVEIQWSANQVDNINIDISYDSGLTWNEVENNISAEQESFSWSVPDLFSKSCYFRISDNENQSIYDWSTYPFTIAKLELLSPAGGEEIIGGSAVQITWESINIELIKLEYSDDNGENWTVINESVNAEDNYYIWTTPILPSSEYIIRISDAEFPEIVDLSENTFEIINQNLTIDYPDSEGKRLRNGEQCIITWTQAEINSLINIYFSTNGGETFNEIAANVDPEDGNFIWTVPDINTTMGRIKISLADNPDVYFITENNFTIFKLELSSPEGGDYWRSNMDQLITWEQYNLISVKLEFSTDGGSNWETITSSTDASSLDYYWFTPDANTDSCLIRISDADNYEVYSVNSEFFSIGPPVVIEKPAGGEVFLVNSIHSINWVSSNCIENVVLDYSVDGGSNWLIIQSTPYPASNENYDWFVPDNQSNQALVRISDADNSSVYGISENDFIITSELLPPTNLIAVAGNEMVYLTWDVPGTNVGFNIYRDSEQINASLVETNEYVDYNLTNGLTYNYYVKAVYAMGESEASNSIEVTPEELEANLLHIEGIFTVFDKDYDGTIDAVLDNNNLNLVGILYNQEVYLENINVEFVSSDVGQDISVIIASADIEGEHAENYELSLEGAPSTTANINSKEITITGSFTAFDKEYDGTTLAEIDNNNLSLSGVITNEDVYLTDISSEFITNEIDEDIPVIITSADIDGEHSGNYLLSLSDAPETLANIAPKQVYITGTFTVFDKEYDGTIFATIDNNNLSLIGVITNEDAYLTDISAEFITAEVGEDIPVIISDAYIDGEDLNNYELSFEDAPTTTANITGPTFITGIPSDNLVISPNPFNNYIYLSNTENISKISISNIIGQIIIEKENFQNSKISTSFLDNGVYLISIELSDGKTRTFKMIKQ